MNLGDGEKRARSSASTAGSIRMAAHQHPASWLQLNGAPHCEHFFSTVVDTGFGNRLGKSMAFHGLFQQPFWVAEFKMICARHRIRHT
jgi:hypothetical protein